jgi:hypothetical protein
MDNQAVVVADSSSLDEKKVIDEKVNSDVDVEVIVIGSDGDEIRESGMYGALIV